MPHNPAGVCWLNHACGGALAGVLAFHRRVQEQATPDAAGGRSGAASMIARIWRGWASAATANDYQRHYESEVAEHLRAVSGFRGARLLRRQDGDEVLFTSIAFFTSMDAVVAFAGANPDHAVVEETARRALIRWDDRVAHHEVAVDLLP